MQDAQLLSVLVLEGTGCQKTLVVAGKSVSLACGEHSVSTATKTRFEEPGLSKKSIMGSTGYLQAEGEERKG